MILPTERRRAAWTSILLMVLAALALAACASATPATPATSAPPSAPESVAAPETSFDPAVVNSAVALDKMAGHLYTSWQLWQVQNYPLAATHSGHTLGESLPQVEGTLPVATTDALQAALTTYQTAASATGDQTAAQQAYQGAVDAIAAARQTLPNGDDPRFQAQVIREVLEATGREYAEGVDASELVNIAEYQDAFGFVAVVRDHYTSLSATVRERDAGGADEIDEKLDELDAALSVVMPAESLTPADTVAEAVGEIRAELGKIFDLTDAATLSPAELVAQVREMTQHGVDEYAEGNNDEAYELAANAYLEGFEPLEGDLLVKDRELVTAMEGQFKELRDQIKAGAPLADVQAVAAAIGENVDKAEALLK